jgi:hypothetical protein
MDILYVTIFPPGALATFGIPDWIGEVLILVPKGRIGVHFTNEFMTDADKYSKRRSTERRRKLD